MDLFQSSCISSNSHMFWYISCITKSPMPEVVASLYFFRIYLIISYCFIQSKPQYSSVHLPYRDSWDIFAVSCWGFMVSVHKGADRPSLQCPYRFFVFRFSQVGTMGKGIDGTIPIVCKPTCCPGVRRGRTEAPPPNSFIIVCKSYY